MSESSQTESGSASHHDEPYGHPLGIWIGITLLWILGSGIVYLLSFLFRSTPADV